jgi:curved DNA-binding protein CbpA
VTDYFALLDEPRRPWLDEEELKSRFFNLSTSVHPDHAHSLPEKERNAAHQRYTELNAAYHCLREPKERLRHLIELRTGKKPAPVQQVPDALVDIFFEVGKACREVDEFLKRKASVTSPLLLVNLFEESQVLSERLMKLRQDLEVGQEQLGAELKQLNSDWQEHLRRLEEIQQTLSYLRRWSTQLQERIAQLAV